MIFKLIQRFTNTNRHAAHTHTHKSLFSVIFFILFYVQTCLKINIYKQTVQKCDAENLKMMLSLFQMYNCILFQRMQLLNSPEIILKGIFVTQSGLDDISVVD